MAAPPPAPRDRLRSLLLGALLVGLAAVAAWIVADDLHRGATALRGGTMSAAGHPVSFTARMVFIGAMAAVLAGAGAVLLVDAARPRVRR